MMTSFDESGCRANRTGAPSITPLPMSVHSWPPTQILALYRMLRPLNPASTFADSSPQLGSTSPSIVHELGWTGDTPSAYVPRGGSAAAADVTEPTSASSTIGRTRR